MTEPYRRLEDPPQIDAVTAASVLQQPIHVLKYHRSMLKLSVTELVLAIVILVLGVGCVASDCKNGTAVWTGVLAVVSASIGVAAMKRLRNKCLLIAYFVLSILSAVSIGILVLFSAINVGNEAENIKYRSYVRAEQVIVLTENVVLVLVALAYAICCIVSSSLLCYTWGCSKCCTEGDGYHNPNLANVIYMPSTGVSQQFGGNQQYILVPMSQGVTFGNQSSKLILQPRELQPLTAPQHVIGNTEENT